MIIQHGEAGAVDAYITSKSQVSTLGWHLEAKKSRSLEWHEKCSNFFVFQYFLIKNSVRSDLLLNRTNPESIKSGRSPRGIPSPR